jgi:hypothetical protein
VRGGGGGDLIESDDDCLPGIADDRDVDGRESGRRQAHGGGGDPFCRREAKGIEVGDPRLWAAPCVY